MAERLRSVRPFAATAAWLLAAIVAALHAPAAAQQPPPVSQLRAMAEAAATQWIGFREWQGDQLIYFTIPLTYHCGLSEIRYSLNDASLNQRFPLPECHPQMPYSVDPTKDQLYLKRMPGSITTVSVQLIYTDGVKSPVRVFQPCEAVGEATCGVLLDSTEKTDLPSASGRSTSNTNTR